MPVCKMWRWILLCLNFVVIALCTNSSTPPPTLSVQFSPVQPEVTVNSREVTETQHATCHIITERLAATARATVTRALKGVCNSKELEDHFHNLEVQLIDKVNVMKTVIHNIEAKIIDIGNILKKTNSNQAASLRNTCENERTILEENLLTSNENEHVLEKRLLESPRNEEIDKYNYTVHEDSSKINVFTYYWNVVNIDYKLTGWSQKRFLRSPSFYINNTYRMYLKIFPRQNGENTYVHVGLTHGIFDNNLQWPFKLKTKVSVLDQTEIKKAEDITSRIWNPHVLCSSFNWQKPVKERDNYECVGLGFSLKTLRSRNYIINDSIIIKLSVFLE